MREGTLDPTWGNETDSSGGTSGADGSNADAGGLEDGGNPGTGGTDATGGMPGSEDAGQPEPGTGGMNTGGMNTGGVNTGGMNTAGGTDGTQPTCGNEMVEPPEQCDPPGEGCEDDCTLTPAPVGSIQELVGALDGRLIQLPCRGGSDDDACEPSYILDGTLSQCDSGFLELTVDHPIGGTPGAIYQASLHLYGVVEPKVYGSTERREAGEQRPDNSDDGANPAPWYVGDPGERAPESLWNVYGIYVFDESGTEVGTYFINSDTEEGRWDYVLNYERTIPIVGGGNVRIHVYDSNCSLVKNCSAGASRGPPCDSLARTVDISEADPQPPGGSAPAGFDQPGIGNDANNAGQWFLIDVTAVEPM